MPLMEELKRLDPQQAVAALDASADRMGLGAVDPAEKALADETARAAEEILERDYPALAELVKHVGQRFGEAGGGEYERMLTRAGATAIVLALKEYGENELFPTSG
jgi:hypothetical protein